MSILDFIIPHTFVCSRSRASWTRPLLCGLVAVLLIGGAASAQGSAPVETISIDEITRGMRGYGMSVFAGTELKRFDVEVVGKLENLNAGMSFIMANLSGQNLEASGVIAGMSGSPVYFDGKLAGAVAFSWDFSQGALAGITPIATMRALSDLPARDARIGQARAIVAEPRDRAAAEPLIPALSALPFSESAEVSVPSQLSRLLRGDLEPLLRRSGSRAELDAWVRATSAPLFDSMPTPDGAVHALHWTTVGFGSQVRSVLAGGLGERWVYAGGSASGRADTQTPLPPLRAGGPVAALLVSGDLQMAVNGTITERRGDEILAFGHQYLGLGPVSLPMAKSEVVTVVSSRASSFKISNLGEVVGAFDEDRLAGMRGQVGAVADTTPLEIINRHPLEGERRFSMQLADLEPMRPLLVASSVLQAVESATRSAGKGGLDMRARLQFADREPLLIGQSFDGSGAVIDAAIYLLQVVAFVELNSLEDVPLEHIEVEIEQSDSIRTEELVEAFAARRAVRPGEVLPLRLRLRDYRGATRTETLDVPIPADAVEGSYYLFVGDGVSVDAAATRIEPAVNRTMNDGLAQLASLRSAKDLVVMGVRAEKGVVGGGGSLPALPGSMREVWQGSSAGQVKGTTLAAVAEHVQRRQRPLRGIARIDLSVLEPKR